MNVRNSCRKKSYLLPFAVVICLSTPIWAAPDRMPMPDFTKGDGLPPGASHDWNLGPIGVRGWMYSDKQVTTDARQIYITQVDQQSPADGILSVGDVILGVGDKPFSFDPRTELGKGITKAEMSENRGALSLIRWRSGKTENVVITLPVVGTYSETAPYDCAKSKRILEEGCQRLAERVGAPSYRVRTIPRCLNALALLASGNADYLPLVRKEAQWAAGFSAGGFQTWYYGYVITFLSEYVLATGDESVMPGLKRLALESAKGQSVVGSWGHRFAQADGRLGGYGMMNSPGLPLTIGLVLAREAGVKDPLVDRAIERSARLLRFYIGKGAIPYGDHHPWIQTHDDNGKCGMAAVLFNLLNEAEGAEFFSRMSIASHGSERDTGHTGNFFNILWSLPGVAISGPEATGAWMKEYGGWYFELARRPDGSFVHQGPPGLKNDRYGSWDCSGSYLLAYALPLKKLYLTGKRESSAPQIDASTADALIKDGHGWTNKDRNGFYDELDAEELLDRLGSWSPVVRRRAAMALGRREKTLLPKLLVLLDSSSLDARYGACEALAELKGNAAPAVPALMETLGEEDLWLRVKAADALASIGDPAMPAVPQLLRMLAKGPSNDDPRAMEQRYLCFAVFGRMLKRSLDGVDREQLRNAVATGLKNQDGRARGTIGGIYQRLRYEEIKPLLPAIHEAIVKPAPSGIMFASGIRLQGIDLFAKHRIQEGIPLCLEVMETDKWGKQGRITQCLKSLGKYGPAAKSVLPQLRELEKELQSHREAKGLQSQIGQIQKLIQSLENATGTIELRSLEDPGMVR